MGKINKVVASPSGQIFKNEAKNIKPRKKEKFNKDEQPVSRSQDIEQEGNYKGARVMSAKVDVDLKPHSNHEYKRNEESPNPDYDGRCHPYWRKVI